MIWEDILSTHPKDMLALQMLFFTHLTTGRRRGLRDCVTRVAKHHRPGESRSGKIFLILSIFWQNVAGVSFVSTTVFALILLLFILGYLLQLGVCCCCCCFCCCCCCCFQLVELSICNQKNIPPSQVLWQPPGQALLRLRAEPAVRLGGGGGAEVSGTKGFN